MKLILSILIISIPLDIFAQKKAMSISESSDELERVEKQLKDSKDPVGLLDEEIAEKAGGSKPLSTSVRCQSMEIIWLRRAF